MKEYNKSCSICHNIFEQCYVIPDIHDNCAIWSNDSKRYMKQFRIYSWYPSDGTYDVINQNNNKKVKGLSENEIQLINHKKPVILGCGHVFHDDCLSAWEDSFTKVVEHQYLINDNKYRVVKNLSCPNCREIYNKINMNKKPYAFKNI